MLRLLLRYYERSFRSHPLLTLAMANGICSICGDGAAQLIPILTSKEQPDVQLNFDFSRLMRYFVFGFNMGPYVISLFTDHNSYFQLTSSVTFLHRTEGFRIGGKWNEFLDRHLQPRSKTIEAGEKLGVEHDVEMSLIGSPTASSSTLPTHSTSKSTGGAPLSLFTIFKMVLADQLLIKVFRGLRLPCECVLTCAFSSDLSTVFLGYMGITEGADLVELQNRIQRLFWKLLIVNWQVWPIIQVIYRAVFIFF
ncbi:hypothetical protein DFH28DRAFT_888725 [Melampsora americana]|nr:hypothetical protein DFH28DRAFT_888725 [Melampsora americana]